MKKALLIPVKDPARAKTRLAGLLSPEERVSLVWTMFQDVVAAAAAVTHVDSVALVTSYRRAIEAVRPLRWIVLEETRQKSESHSVDWACSELKSRGFDLVLRLPADIPLVRASDIENLLDTGVSHPGAIVVPSRDGTGTNALGRTPPDLFPSHFGPNSLSLHREEAARAAAGFVVIANSRIALDVDDPADLEELLKHETVTGTQGLLKEMGLPERLARQRS